MQERERECLEFLSGGGTSLPAGVIKTAGLTGTEMDDGANPEADSRYRFPASGFAMSARTCRCNSAISCCCALIASTSSGVSLE